MHELLPNFTHPCSGHSPAVHLASHRIPRHRTKATNTNFFPAIVLSSDSVTALVESGFTHSATTRINDETSLRLL